MRHASAFRSMAAAAALTSVVCTCPSASASSQVAMAVSPSPSSMRLSTDITRFSAPVSPTAFKKGRARSLVETIAIVAPLSLRMCAWLSAVLVV